MVRLRRIRLADHRGRDATVLLVPVGETTKRLHQDTEVSVLHGVPGGDRPEDDEDSYDCEHVPVSTNCLIGWGAAGL